MKLSNEIIAQMLDKAGLSINSPAVAERLADEIGKVTGDRLGVNTIKRLLGIYEDGRNPHRFTLDMVARYLDFDSYEALLKQSKNGNSEFITDKDLDVDSATLAVGTLVTITYQPAREIMLRYEGDEKYTVVRSTNSKLQKADICTISHLIKGQPLFASQVVRDQKDLGRFIGGEEGGIKITEII